MEEILIRYGSVTSVPVTPSVIAAYRSGYKNYKEAMEMEKSQQSKESLLARGRSQLKIRQVLCRVRSETEKKSKRKLKNL